MDSVKSSRAFVGSNTCFVFRMESSLSDGRIISGQLFTAFDEETKGTSASAEVGVQDQEVDFNPSRRSG